MTPSQLAALSEADRLALAAAVEELEFADPVEFGRRVLGFEPWEKQVEIMRAVRDTTRVAVRSGHKIGKSACAAAIALWWYHTRPQATVILTSSADDLVRIVLWNEIKKLYSRAPELLGGDMHDGHRAGLVNSRTGSRIIGLASNKGENMAGISGMDLLFIIDEASGVADPIFDTIEGNRAGGARAVMFGNPTQQSGRFYEAFHDDRAFWRCIHVSSETTPNAVTGEIVVPGLATREYIDEMRLEWGEDSAWYQVRVKGEFPDAAEDAVIGLELVQGSSDGWREPRPDDGTLEVGVDVSRFGDDETVIFPRRGLFAGTPVVMHGTDTFQISEQVRALVRRLRIPSERPVVRVDGGGVGGGVVDQLRQRAEFEVVDANAAQSAGTDEHSRLRDRLWFNLRDWLAAGGRVPKDRKLVQEMAAPTYAFDVKGRLKVETKDDIRAKLRPQRSPDRADALALAVLNRTAPASAAYDAPNYLDDAPDPDALAIERRINEICEGWR